MATWALTTFSTLADLAKIEEEVLSNTSIGTNLYTATAVNIADATNPIATSVASIDVSNGKGVTEIVGVVNTAITIADGYGLTVKLYDSADDITFAEINTGSMVYYRAASGADIEIAANAELFRWVVPSICEDHVKAVITSSIYNSGKLDIYSISKFTDKIVLAKTIMGNDIQELLVNRGYQYWTDFSTGEILLDIITNKAIFNIVSSYKTLELVYLDISNGVQDTINYSKMEMYRKLYKSSLDTAMHYVDLDINQDGTTDIYKAKVNSIGRNLR